MAFSIQHALRAIDRRAPDLTEDRDKMRKAMAPRLDPNSLENRMARARQQELSILDQIKLLREEGDSELVRSRLDTAFNRLGEIFAEQGRYAEAITVTKDEVRRKKYLDTLNAIKQPDSQTCNCSDIRVMNKQKEEVIPVRFKTETVVSGLYGRLVEVEVCSACGYKNAR